MDGIYDIKSVNEATGVLECKIPTPVLRAIEAGSATMTLEFGSHGVDAWVRFTKPGEHHISRTLEDAGLILGLVSPPRTSSKGKAKAVSTAESMSKGGISLWDDPDNYIIPDDASVSDESELRRDLGQMTVDPVRKSMLPTMSFAQADRMVSQRGLGQRRLNGVLNLYPSDSLVKEDFKRASLDDFVARTTVVAHNIGTDKLVSRITAGGMKIPGCVTLIDWWEKAPAQHKLKLLSSAKKCNPRQCDERRLNEIGAPFGAAGSRAGLGEPAEADDW
jgi:hypothetical protein